MRGYTAGDHRMRRHKFNARKTNGYDSGHEANVAANLHALEKAGKIQDLREQVKIEIIPKFKLNGKSYRAMYYVADFVYSDGGKTVYLDAKGFRTPMYKAKVKLLAALRGIEVTEC